MPPVSTGVRCEDGACARIELNKLISGRGGRVTSGVWLGATGTFVNANTIAAGCATQIGTGLQSVNSFARVQNNAISGSGGCPGGGGNATSYGVRAVLAAGANELDLHSNDLFALGAQAQCTSRA